jgi:uncharacterized protein YbaP (TraB family)
MARKAHGWLCALCLLGSLSAQAASPVWAIRGEHGTVYLAGSIHLLRSADATLPPAFERAYHKSSILVMELDLGRLSPQDVADWMSRHGRAAPGTVRRSLGEERFQKVVTEAARLGVPAQTVESEAPWLLGLQLLDLEYLKAGFDPDAGVEEQLTQRARGDGKPTAGLETLEQQLGVFGTMGMSDQTRFLMLTVNELPELPRETQDVVTAWKAGDAPRLAQLLGEEYKSFPRLYRALVTERNQHWLPQIEKLLGQSQDSLVVVGALHLVGDGGLLELLRRDGHRPVSME